MTHPCLTCGACCASFRVDFSVHETQEWGGDVPDGRVVEVMGLAHQVGLHRIGFVAQTAAATH